jgi:glycosyltransferase involved in cell wall biosynthesis
MTVLFLVNGDPQSAMGDRASAFARRLSPRWRSVLAWRTGSRRDAQRAFDEALAATRPDVVYVMDLAVAGVAAAARWRIRHQAAVIVDTGDAITALARSAGRNPLALAATAGLERTGLWLADHVVVRGTRHHELLTAEGRASTVIPDGVDLQAFSAVDPAPARADFRLGDSFVVGLLGSCAWNPRLRIAYGWDIVDALALLRDVPVTALLIGDGSGIGHLQQRAAALGVADRLRFTGRRPLADLPALLSACDVCLSTQTNDLVGNVRTTGKLPLYLGCERFVLASAVGEAARVLPPEMLLPYDGVVDGGYPRRLAQRIRELLPRAPLVSPVSRQIAAACFDYDRLASRVERVLDAVVTSSAVAALASPADR